MSHTEAGQLARSRAVLRRLALAVPALRRVVEQRDEYARHVRQLRAEVQQRNLEVQRLAENEAALRNACDSLRAELARVAAQSNVSDIVLQARENLSRASQESDDRLPDPGWRWHAYCIHARRQANQLRTPIEVIHSVQAPASNAGFEARMVGRQLVGHARLMERTCRELFPDFADKIASFAETPLAFPQTTTVLNGRPVSSPLYNHIIHTLRCLSHLRPERVVEIGGGYGAAARLWMTNVLHRPNLYVDVDFPESLFYAEVYLRETLPDHDIIYLHRGRPMPTPGATRPAVVLCPISNLDAVLDCPMDLIVNTGSLQEMTDAYVAFYMDAIERSKCNAFYSANYFAQPIQTLMESMNMAAPVVGRSWHAEFKTYHDDQTRGVAEVLFVRKPDRDPGAARAELQAKLQALPRNGKEFLDLFDAARKVDDSDLLVASAASAVTGMPFAPKEALFLARRASQFGELSDPARALLTLLERMAAEGRADSGIVDPTVATIKDELMSAGRAPPPDARLKEYSDATVLETDGAERTVRRGQYGVIEHFQANGSSLFLSGWAVDRDGAQAAKLVHVFVDGARVISVAPSMARSEFGLGDIPLGFEATIRGCDPRTVAVVAEFPDGSLGQVEVPASH